MGCDEIPRHPTPNVSRRVARAVTLCPAPAAEQPPPFPDQLLGHHCSLSLQLFHFIISCHSLNLQATLSHRPVRLGNTARMGRGTRRPRPRLRGGGRGGAHCPLRLRAGSQSSAVTALPSLRLTAFRGCFQLLKVYESVNKESSSFLKKTDFRPLHLV